MTNRTYQPHYSTAHDPRTLRTREALRDAMLKLLVEKPLEQITIRDITGRAGVSYVTFFRHHPTREALLHDVAAEQVRRLSDLMLPALEARDTRGASTAMCLYVQENRKLWRTLLTGGAAAVLREELLHNAADVASSRSDPHSWLPPDLAVTLNVSSTIELLAWWLRQKRPLPAERIAEIHERIVIGPMIAANAADARASGAQRKAPGRPSGKGSRSVARSLRNGKRTEG